MKDFVWRDANIRLVGYRATTVGDPATLLRDWRDRCGGGSPGLVHREICRQVPAWNAAIARGVHAPSPSELLDYAVLRPDADQGSLVDPACEGFERLEASYDVAFRFGENDPPDEPGAVLFNLFELVGPSPAVQGFITNWVPRAEFQAQREGFISATLHVRRAGSLPALAFNRAEWVSADLYERVIDPFEQAFPRSERLGGPRPALQVTSRLALYRVEALARPEPWPAVV